MKNLQNFWWNIYGLNHCRFQKSTFFKFLFAHLSETKEHCPWSDTYSRKSTDFKPFTSSLHVRRICSRPFLIPDLKFRFWTRWWYPTVLDQYTHHRKNFRINSFFDSNPKSKDFQIPQTYQFVDYKLISPWKIRMGNFLRKRKFHLTETSNKLLSVFVYREIIDKIFSKKNFSINFWHELFVVFCVRPL